MCVNVDVVLVAGVVGVVVVIIVVLRIVVVVVWIVDHWRACNEKIQYFLWLESDSVRLR